MIYGQVKHSVTVTLSYRFSTNIKLTKNYYIIPKTIILYIITQSYLKVNQNQSEPRASSGVLTDGGPDPVALGVDEPSDLREVAVPLADVLDAGGLHEEGVVRGEHSLDALAVVLHQRRVLPAAHERPHLLVGRDLGFLERRSKVCKMQSMSCIKSCLILSLCYHFTSFLYAISMVNKPKKAR